jgi:hypothetical protein
VVFTLGNHDLELRLPSCQSLLSERIGGSLILALDGAGARFTFPGLRSARPCLAPLPSKRCLFTERPPGAHCIDARNGTASEEGPNHFFNSTTTSPL